MEDYVKEHLPGYLKSCGIKVVDTPSNDAADIKAYYNGAVGIEDAADMHVHMGRHGSGKSWWLCGIAAESSHKGDDTVMVLLDSTSEDMMNRMYANYCGIPLDKYVHHIGDTKYIMDVLNAYKREHNEEKIGIVLMAELPVLMATIDNIEEAVKAKDRSLQDAFGPERRIKNVIIDNTSLIQLKQSSIDVYSKVKETCQALHDMAKRNGWTLITSVQTRS